MRIFDVSSAAHIRTLSTADAWAMSIAFSQDGSLIAAGLATNASTARTSHLARQWDTDTGKQITDLEGHRNWEAGRVYQFRHSRLQDHLADK